MAAPVNANINIVLNTKKATAQIRALQTEINSFNKSVVAANSAAARQQAALNKALIDSAMASGMFNAKIVPTTAGIHRFSEALDKGKLSLNEYTRGAASQLPGMRRILIREFDMITKVAEDRVKRLQTQYTALGNAQKALALQPTALAMENMATQTALAAQKQMIFNKMISDGSTKLLNWGKNTQWAGRQLMVGFTLPLTMFGATAAKVFMDLDKQARDFKRVYGDLFTPPAEIESNLKAIQQLGDEYTKYGVKVSDTMQVAATAAAAGMKNEKLIAGTEESLRLATIGQIDYNQALDTTISLQTAFKMSADELAPSVDFLGAVANQTVLTIDDMTKAIPRVAPVVQGLGGDVKDLAAMLVAMREGGVSAENAANGLKSGLASLINPTNAAKEKLKELGINITAIVEANKGDLMGTVMDFGTALSKLGDFERQQALEKTFGKYQYARLGALFDNIIKKGGQAEVALTLAGKSAEELGQLSAKSLKEIEESTTAKFTGAVERLKVAIAPVGEAFLKALTPVIEFITKIADKFNSLPDGIKNAIAIVTAVVAGIGPVILMLVGLIANAGANIIKFIQMMRKGFARMRGDASAFEYLAGAELDAAAAAASLEGKTNRLTDAILIQENAVRTLIGLYEKLASSASAAARAMPTTMGGPIAGRRGGRGAAPMKMATGGVVPGSGSGDKIPALLEPGETVVTKQASQSYGPVLAAMNSGNLPGFVTGNTRSTGDVFVYAGEEFSALPKSVAGISEIIQRLEASGRTQDEIVQSLKTIQTEQGKVTKAALKRQIRPIPQSARGGQQLQLPDPEMKVAGHVGGRTSVPVARLRSEILQDPTKFTQGFRETVDIAIQRGVQNLELYNNAVIEQMQSENQHWNNARVTIDDMKETLTDPRKQTMLRRQLEELGYSGQQLEQQIQTFVNNLGEELDKAKVRVPAGDIVARDIAVSQAYSAAGRGTFRGGAERQAFESMLVPTTYIPFDTGGRGRAGMYSAQSGMPASYADMDLGYGRRAIRLSSEEVAGFKRGGSSIGGDELKRAFLALNEEQRRQIMSEGDPARNLPFDPRSPRILAIFQQGGQLAGVEWSQGFVSTSTAGSAQQPQAVLRASGRRSPNPIFGITGTQEGQLYANSYVDSIKASIMSAPPIPQSGEVTSEKTAKQKYKESQSASRREKYYISRMQSLGMSDTQILRQLIRLEERKAKARQSEQKEVAKAAILAERNAKLAAQTSASMQQQSAGMAQGAGAKGFFGKVVGTDAEGNPITRGQRMKRRFGRFTGGGAMSGAGMGLMTASMMAPMLPGKAGEMADKAQPALMGLSTLAMIGPMLTNPAGAVVAGLLASAGALVFFKAKADEMAENAQKFSNSLIAGRQTVKKIGEFYGRESLARKSDLVEMKKISGEGTKKQDIVKAEEFLKSDVGVSLQEGMSQALKTMGGDAASKQFANNLSAMVLQGVINPKEARAIATVMGQQLNNKTFGIKAVGTLSTILGPNGENLEKDPLKVALEIDKQNQQTVNQMTSSIGDLSMQMQDYTKATVGDLGAMFVPVFGQINAINKITLGWDNWIGDIARSARGILNTDDFEIANQNLLAMGGVIGNQLSQSYDNLNAAKQRYLELSKQAEAIDSKDVNAKAAAESAARKAKAQQDLLTESINKQKEAFTRAYMSAPEGAARTVLLQGMQNSLSEMYKDNPVMQTALDMVSGKLKDLQSINPELNFKITSELVSGQLDPLTLQYLMDLYKTPGQAAYIYTTLSARLEGDSAAATKFVQAMMQGGFEESMQFQIETITRGMSPEQIAAYTITLQELSLIEDPELKKTIALESAGLTVEQLERQNKGLEIINGLSPEIKKKILVASNAQSAIRIGRWYQNFQKFPNIEKEIFLEDSQYYDALNAARISYEQFDALPDIQKALVMTNIQRYIDLGGGANGASTPGQRAAMEAANAAAAAAVADAFTPPVKDDGKGGGGGEKEKSALKELMDSIDERLKLYTNFFTLMKKYKGKKNAFAKAINEATLGGGLADKLRKFNLNESLIADILSKGAESAQKIINALEKRKGLAKKMDAKDILGRAGEQMNELIAGRNKAIVQTKAANMARSEGASQEALQRISESYELSYKFTKLPKEKRMKFILDVQQSIDAEKTLEYAQDPNKMLQDQIDLIKTAQDVATYANRKKIEGLQRELELVNRQISAIEELNEKDRQRIRGLERQKEMIQRQIDAYERQNEMDQRRIDALRRQDEVRNRVADALSHDLDTMSKQEQSIRDQYQERIDALNEINQLNDHIVESQKQQLGLSQALSQGDIYAAAAAAQDMQASQGQYAREQQDAALQQGMENQVAGLTTPGGLTRAQAEEQINAIKEQSYQTSLQIRDIEDQIYNRNLLMVPLKDQQYQLDLQIRDINDVIFDRETEILNIQNTKLKPLQSQIVAEQDILEAKNLVFENAISALEIEMKQNELLQKSISNVNTLAGSWNEVQKQIALANKTLAQKIQDAGPAPKQLKGVSASEFQAQVNAYKGLLKQFEDEHKAAVEAAMKHGAEALASTTMYAGGYVKKYATGNYVVGSGGRDSVPAMLTPGEFVVRKAMVDKMGVPALNRINQGAISPGRMFAGGTPRFNESTGSYAIPKEFTPPKFTAPRFSIPENKMATGNIQKQALQASMPQYSSNTGYNNVSVNVNVPQTNASPDTIANKVAMRIQDIHRRGIGNERVYKQ